MALQVNQDSGKGVTLSYFRVSSICTYFINGGDKTTITYGAYVSKEVRESDLDNWFWQAGAVTGSQNTSLLSLAQTLNTSGVINGVLFLFNDLASDPSSNYFRVANVANNAYFMVTKSGDARASLSFGLAQAGDGQWTKTTFSQISTSALVWSSDLNATHAFDTAISRNAAGVVQIGTTANNALGTLLVAGLTASGTVKMTGLGTVDPHVVGQLWSNSGVLTVSAG